VESIGPLGIQLYPVNEIQLLQHIADMPPVAHPKASESRLRKQVISNRRISLWTVVFLSSVYVLASSGRARTPDEYMTLFQAESLIENGTTAVPQSLQAQNFYGKYDLHHQPRSPYPAGQAILAVAFVWFAGSVVSHLPGVAQDRTTQFYLEGFAATLSSAMFAALGMGVFFLLLRRLQLTLRDAIAVTACVAFATLLFPYSGYFFSEPLTTLLLLCTAYTLFGSDAPLSRRRAISAGVLLAFAVWVRPTMVLAAGVFTLAIAIREKVSKWRSVVLALAIPGISAIGYLAWNKHLFGRAFEFGYPDTAELGKHLNTFTTPFHVGLFGLLFSPGKSIFLYFPPVVLAVWGLRRLWKFDRGLAILCGVLPLVYLLFYARYTQWEGGYCVGPRYMLPSLIVCCVALAPVMQCASRRLRNAVFALALLGFVVQIVSYSTSFLEDQVGGAQYYDTRFDYRLSYNPMLSQTQRLWHYLHGAPAPLGLGFDRWPVFLSKLGIKTGTLLVIAIPPLVLAIWSFWALRRSWINAELIDAEEPSMASAGVDAS
jgi:hypothetical protein